MASNARELLAVEGAYTWNDFRFEDDRGDYCNIDTGLVSLEAGTACSGMDVLRGMHCSPFPKVVGCLAGEMPEWSHR